MRDIIERAAANNAIRQQRVDQNRAMFGTTPSLGGLANALLSIPEQIDIERTRQVLQPQQQQIDLQDRTTLARAIGGIDPNAYTLPEMKAIRAKQIEAETRAQYNPMGGATDYVIQKLMMDNPKMSYTDALAYLKGGASAGGKMDVENRKTAQFNLPKIESDTSANISLLDNLTNHKGFSDAVGFKGLSSAFGLKEKPVAGSDAAGFNALFNQIKGKQFTSVVNTLKGMGALSDAEGKKLEQSVAAMDTATSEEDFIKARDAYKQTLQTALDLAKQQAGITPSATPDANISPAEKAAQGIPNIDNLSPEEANAYSNQPSNAAPITPTATKNIGGKIYVQHNGKWFEQ